MQIFSDIETFNRTVKPENYTAVAIGKFDGIHKGHQKLIDVIDSYKGEGLKSIVFTFEKPIADYFTGCLSSVLTTNKEKISYLESMGVDYLYIMPVVSETVSYEPVYFIRDILFKGLHARLIAAGGDLSFGDKGAGNMELLKDYSSKLGYRAVEIEKILYKNRELSSTIVREAVTKGEMEEVREMLGRPYSIDGTVSYGKQLGRTIDMPTANIVPDEHKLMPPFGVYFSNVCIEGKEYRGVTNIGVKPTVTDEKKVTAETYIYDMDDDIYGMKISVGLQHFVRKEMRFPNIEMLKKQMHDDSIKGISYFNRMEKI